MSVKLARFNSQRIWKQKGERTWKTIDHWVVYQVFSFFTMDSIYIIYFACINLSVLGIPQSVSCPAPFTASLEVDFGDFVGRTQKREIEEMEEWMSSLWLLLLSTRWVDIAMRNCLTLVFEEWASPSGCPHFSLLARLVFFFLCHRLFTACHWFFSVNEFCLFCFLFPTINTNLINWRDIHLVARGACELFITEYKVWLNYLDDDLEGISIWLLPVNDYSFVHSSEQVFQHGIISDWNLKNIHLLLFVLFSSLLSFFFCPVVWVERAGRSVWSAISAS